VRAGWVSGKLRRLRDEQALDEQVRVRFAPGVSDAARDAFLEGVESAGVPQHPDVERATPETLREVLERRHEEMKRDA
jgi:hypothetical protein